MGYQDSVNGTAVTETFLDENSKQVVMKYATAAARTADAALTAALREGMVSYLDDLNVLQVYTGSTWSTVGPVHGGFPTWTPTIIQGATPTQAVAWASYSRIGRRVFGEFAVSITSTATAATDITIALPVAADASIINTRGAFGTYILEDASTITYYGPLAITAASVMKMRSIASAVVFQGNGAMTAALASGDTVSGQFSYWAAADA